MQIMIIIITISIWLVNLYTSKYFAKKAFFFYIKWKETFGLYENHKPLSIIKRCSYKCLFSYLVSDDQFLAI